jgi:hypothetical protein
MADGAPLYAKNPDLLDPNPLGNTGFSLFLIFETSTLLNL